MQIFKNNIQTLTTLREIPFKLEKEIQSLFEKNLEVLSGLKLVKSEFSIKNSRIDTLAFDPQSNAFVIIEYKRSQNYSVVDQGVSYLNLMLDYQADFIVEYNEVHGASLKRNEIDWSQSRVVFVSPSFTDFQKQSTNFKDFGIELWEIKQFEHDVMTINQIKKTKSAPSIAPLQKSESLEISKLAKEIKVYSEEDHLKGKSDATAELYETYKNAIFNLGADIDVKPQKMVIGFTCKGKVFADVLVLKSELKFWINLKAGKLDDPKLLARDVSKVGTWGNGDYELRVRDAKNLEYIMSLFKQSFTLAQTKV
jgi:predicted transport protein